MSVVYKRRAHSVVSASSDDAYQSGTTVVTAGNGLVLSADGDIIGIRFQNIDVPRGVTITSSKFKAWFQSGTANLRIHAEANNNAPAFTTASNNIGERDKTEEYVYWNASITSGEQDTPDFSNVIQEVIDRPGWVPGNSIVVLLENQAAAGLTIISFDAASTALKIEIDYQVIAPAGPPTITNFATSTIRLSSSHSVSVPIPAAGGARVFISTHAIRRSTVSHSDRQFDLVGATFNGEGVAALHDEDYFGASSVLRHNVFEVIDPLGGGASSSQTFTVTYSKSVVIGISVIVVTGITERGDLIAWNTGKGANPAVPSMSIDVETEQFPSLILGFGNVRAQGIGHTRLYPEGDAWMLATYQTGSSSVNDLQCFIAAVDSAAPDTYELGATWSANDVGSIVGIPLYGRVEVAEAEALAIDPEILYMDATLDDLTAIAEFAAANDPDVVQGSIPPVQVSGRGQLFPSTSARTLTVILMATSGSKWTIVDSDGNNEQLGLRIIRRAGYLTPI